MPIRPESVKRRTVWINDEDWAAIVERGQAEGKNVSVFLRERALASNGHSPSVRPLASPRPAPKRP